MKNLLVVLITALLASLFAHAQNKDKRTQKVVYLKNGSIIRQTRSLQHIDSLIEVQTIGGSTFRFSAGELDRIAHEPIPAAFRTRGYFIGIEMGVNTGRSFMDNPGNDGREHSPSIQLTSGYYWNSHWATGVGTALDIYQAGTFVPVFVRGMYMPLKSRITPVVSMDIGYGFYTQAFNGAPATNQDIDGGLFLNPAAGFMVRSAYRTAFLFTVGYRHQDWYQSFQNGEVRTAQDMAFRRTSIRMSLLF